MNTPQLFNFESNEIRVVKDESGNIFFVAKDVCRALALDNVAMALARVDDEDKLTSKLLTSGQTRKTWFVTESGLYNLIFSSYKQEAKVFKRWVTSVVLPSIRKTGGYSLSSLVLPSPRQWEKTFPQEFMRQVMRLYGYNYDAKMGTPQFVGKFINKYVYNTLDRQMEKALKESRSKFGGDDEVSFLHQFLSDEGREGLQNHLIAVTSLAAAMNNIDQFDLAFSRVYVHKNQLEMYLR